MVGRPSRRSESGRYTLPKDREWSGGPYVGPKLVWSPSLMSRRGREIFPLFRKWSGCPPRGPGVVGRPLQRSTVIARPSWK